VLTKLQIALGVLAGLAIVVFFAAMWSNRDVAKVPGWLAPVAWGSFGVVMASCVGVMVTLALDREKPDEPEEEESELLPVDESPPEGEKPPAEEPTAEHAETDMLETEPMEVTEPGSEETVEFTTLPSDE